MRILFYSTSSNFCDGKDLHTVTLPSCALQWENLAQKYSEHEFIIATQLPGMFLVDSKETKIKKAKKIQYEIIKDDDEEKIAQFLASLKPELALACSFYVTPFDWLSVKDSIVAENLNKLGIKTLCHPLDTTLACFDKHQTHGILEKYGINCPKSLYIHHGLFINAGNRREIKSNVYKSAVLKKLKTLRYPIIIKDTVGLSSYGMEVTENFEDALTFLKSKRHTSDRIAQEMKKGVHAGTEIYGSNGNYTVMPPFIFSVNKYGITSPKQSVKVGPVTNKNLKIPELNKMLIHLAKSLNFSGIAQVDLVFDGEDWFVIEINPRLSGMTATYAVSMGISTSELIFNSFSENFPQRNFLLTVNIKFPILSEGELLRLKKFNFVKTVNQIENSAAKQLRERGYCEVILCGKTKDEVQENLLTLKNSFELKNEEDFFTTAQKMIEEMF